MRVATTAGAVRSSARSLCATCSTGKRYVYADRGETMLKGFEDALRLYEVRWQP